MAVLCIKMAHVDTGYETLTHSHWFRKHLCGKQMMATKMFSGLKMGDYPGGPILIT